MHLIEDMQFDWDFQKTSVPYDVERECKHVIQDKILPQIEQVLDDWDKANPGMRCVIPKLEIEINCEDYSPDLVKNLVLKHFEYQLKQKTKIASTSGSKTERSEVYLEKIQVDVYQLLFIYLKYGVVENYKYIRNIIEVLKSSETFSEKQRKKFIHLLSEDEQALKRLLNITTQHQQLYEIFFKTVLFYKDKDFIESYFKTIKLYWLPKSKTDFPVEVWKDLLVQSKSLKQFTETLFRILKPVLKLKAKPEKIQKFLLISLVQAYAQFYLKSAVKKLNPIEGFLAAKTSISQSQEKAKENKNNSKLSDDKYAKKHNEILDKEKSYEEKTTQKQTSSEQLKTDSNTKKPKVSGDAKISKENTTEELLEQSSVRQLVLQNVGLLILHPFLNEFLKEAKVLSGKKILQPEKAIQLLHFTATGHDIAKDVELGLEKIILGIPLEHLIDLEKALSEKDKNLCEELLSAVLKHWKVLDKSGNDTLRAMFLVRQGQVQFKQKTIMIEAEHLAQDVLLKKLPWGLGMIKLPWLDRLIQMDWKT